MPRETANPLYFAKILGLFRESTKSKKKQTKGFSLWPAFFLVAGKGIEPLTRGFSEPCTSKTRDSKMKRRVHQFPGKHTSIA
jgi:hypothetical protein